MPQDDVFDLQDFLPYLLNQAADASSDGFQRYYKRKYGMLRTEWRVLFHLGRYGTMTAKEVCARANIHKTKVSRAVRALEEKRFLTRRAMEEDRRLEALALTTAGQAAYGDLAEEARRFDAALMADIPQAHRAVLRDCLRQMAALPTRS